MDSDTDLGREQLLAAISRHLAAPRPLTARLCSASGVVTALFGLIPAGVAAAILCNTRQLDGPQPLVVLGLVLWAAFAIAWGLWYVLDRSPRYVLDENGLADHTGPRPRVFPWGAVSRATLHRSTRRGAEQSATLTLYLNSPIFREREVELDVTNLDHSSEEIFRAVGKWADLR